MARRFITKSQFCWNGHARELNSSDLRCSLSFSDVPSEFTLLVQLSQWGDGGGKGVKTFGFTPSPGRSNGSMANEWKGNQFHPYSIILNHTQSYSTMAPPISHIAFPASVWKICRLQDFHCASLRNLGMSLEHLRVADTNCLLKLLETIFQLEHNSSQNDTRCNVARTNCINLRIICKHMLQHVLPFSILSTTCKGDFGWNSFAFAFKFQSPAEAL